MVIRRAVRSGAALGVSIVVVTLLASGCNGGTGTESNAAPSIEPVADARTLRGDPVEVPFTIVDEDPETVTVDASSSDPTLVADADIEVLGSGADRSVRMTPAPLGTGSVVITLVARDADGLEGTREFELDVELPFQTQFPKLTASDAAASDGFGGSVGISGEYAIVGARGDDLAGSDEGSAYVFRRDVDAWTEIEKLVASDGAPGDRFGVSVAIDGEHAIVGARWADFTGTNEGAAYVFRLTGGDWVEVDKLIASDAADSAEFGFSVSISGDHAIVGAPLHGGSGAAYVFQRSGDVWIEIDKLTASDAASGDQFGYSVAIDGDNAIVGAHVDDLSGTSEGSAYAFRRSGDDWVEIDKLTASDGSDGEQFGFSVAISGDDAIIGAPLANLTGINEGSAYAFRRSGEDWTEIDTLTASDGVDLDRLGWSVAIDGNYAVVGAIWDDLSATDEGSVYVFRLSGDGWVEIEKLTASDGADSDEFGASVAIDGAHAIVGARSDDHSGSNEGSAYVFLK